MRDDRHEAWLRDRAERAEAERDAALAEVARLRAALEEIQRYPTLAAGWQDIAREALRTTSAPPDE